MNVGRVAGSREELSDPKWRWLVDRIQRAGTLHVEDDGVHVNIGGRTHTYASLDHLARALTRALEERRPLDAYTGAN